MQRKTFDTPKGTISYLVSQDPCAHLPWLVFLPGLTADRRLFERQLEHFAPRCNVLAWDPPAHGLSRPFELDFGMDDFALWLAAILDREGAKRPVLVGQSMGGYVAQAFIDLYPGVAAGFVSIDSAPLQRRYYPNWEVAFLRHTEGMYRAIPWGLLKAWAGRGCSETEYGRNLMRAFMDSYDKSEYCALAAFGYRVLADAIDAQRNYKIDCPAVLVCGTKDKAGDVKTFNRKWTAGSGIPLIWVEGAGHNSTCDKPDEINRIIEELLAKAVAAREA